MLDWLEQHPDAARDIGTQHQPRRRHLVDDEFRDPARALRRGQFPPDKLCLEITETSVARDRGRAQRFIGRMRDSAAASRWTISAPASVSFSYLRDLDVDFLKIDGNFVRDMDSSPLAGAVVRSITDIAHVLDKRAIAEHVGPAPARGAGGDRRGLHAGLRDRPADADRRLLRVRAALNRERVVEQRRGSDRGARAGP